MKRYLLIITLYFVIGCILAYIFKTDATSETALLVACCALYGHYNKEE